MRARLLPEMNKAVREVNACRVNDDHVHDDVDDAHDDDSVASVGALLIGRAMLAGLGAFGVCCVVVASTVAFFCCRGLACVRTVLGL